MLHANSGQEVLLEHLAQSMPGEEVQLFNQVPDGNGGLELPPNPLFGEMAGTPIIPPAQTAKGVTLQKKALKEIASTTESITTLSVD